VDAAESLARAGRTAVDSVDDEALGEAIAGLARALALTHDTCAVAGCERPFAWCEIHHHRLSWGRNGRTDLDNGLPLCGHHHRRAHDTRFDLRQRPDGEWAFHRRT